MIVENKNGKPDLSEVPEKYRDRVSYTYIADEDVYEVKLPHEAREEKLRQEFDRKLDERVNQIAEAVASGARGQELANKMKRK